MGELLSVWRELLAVRCPSCGQARIVKGEGLCAACRPPEARSAPLAGPPLCLGGPEALDLPGYPGGLACGEYRGSLRRMILQAKWGPHAPSIPLLRRELHSAVRLLRLPPGLLIAPPASRLRRWQGWHFADALAQGLARRLDWPYARALRRRRERPAQAGLGAAYRRINLTGSFALCARWSGFPRHHSVIENRIYLIDDVLTTGATFRECARCLQQATGAEVRPLVLAWVPGQAAEPRGSPHYDAH